MKKFFAFVLFMLAFSLTFAANIMSVEEARLVSKNFLSERYLVQSINIDVADIMLEHTELDDNGVPVFYRFSVKGVGFVLVSATDAVTPILGYSVEKAFKSNPAVEVYMKSCKKAVIATKKRAEAKGTAMTGAADEWARLLNENFVPTRTRAKEVDPLLLTNWNQDKFYNTYCPYDYRAGSSSDFRTYVGCVALNMSVIRNYYRYPDMGVGAVQYPVYGEEGEVLYIVRANLQVPYNYDAIVDVPTDYTGELAKLIFHSGAAIKIQYGFDGTGSNTAEALDGLQNYFQYGRASIVEAAPIIASGEDTQDGYRKWGDTLKSELDQLRPLFYSATTGEGEVGHAFMIDGYDNQGFFHLNWGWEGHGNGFFRINWLADYSGEHDPTQASFNTRENTIFGLVPPEGSVEKPATSLVHNTAAAGVITDGAGHLPYQNKSNRTWIIAAPNASAYQLSFAKLKTEADNDYIEIFNAKTGAKLAGPFSGNYLNIFSSDNTEHTGIFTNPNTILPTIGTFNCDSVKVVFTSNDSITDNGFLINYKVTNFKTQPACQNYTQANPREGVLTDGNGTYRAHSACSWGIIRASDLTKLTFDFTQFDLKEGDFVDIYDVTDNTKQILHARYDIYNRPQGPFTLDFSKIHINFVSDNWGEGEGFTLQYGGSTGVNENSGLNDLNIFPNPANNVLNVSFSTENAGNISFKMLDMTGKLIYSETMHHLGGAATQQFSVNDLAKGIYFMDIETTSGKTVQKFIVE